MKRQVSNSDKIRKMALSEFLMRFNKKLPIGLCVPIIVNRNFKCPKIKCDACICEWVNLKYEGGLDDKI